MQILKRLFPNMTLSRLARWSAIVGAVVLLVPLIIYLVEDELNTLGFIALVVGVIGLGFWLIVAPEELRAWLSGRQVYYGTGTVVLIVVVIGLAAVGYSLVEQQNAVQDLTENQLFTISQVSRDTIDQFEGFLTANGFSAQIIGFYTREELRERYATRTLLSQFEEESNGVVEVEFIDPDVNPVVAGQYDFSPLLENVPQSNKLFLTVFAENEQIVSVEPIRDVDERQISNAMLRVMLAGNFKMYFVVGHLGYNPTGEGNLGLSTAYSVLPQIGVLVDTLDLSSVESIPDDATAIVIVGPQTPFRQDEVDKIADYIEQGGRMVIMADPPYVDEYETLVSTNTFLLEDSPFSQYLWDEFGIRARENLISDTTAAYANEFTIFVSGIFQDNPIMGGFPALDILFSLARSIEIVDPIDAENPEVSERQAQYIREPMLLTSNDAFGETKLRDVDVDNLADFDADEDIPGPLFLGVSVRHVDDQGGSTNLPRVTLIGDAAWLTNQIVNPLDAELGWEGNIRLWNNIVEWTTQFSEQVDVPPGTRSDLIPLTVNEKEQERIQLVTLVVLPGMILGLGIAVWINRRRH